MASGIKTIIYPTRDLARAKALYSTWLGIAPYIDQPYYVGFRIGEQDIGLDPHGHSKGMTGPLGYCHVANIEESLAQLLEAGTELQQAIKDVGGGKLIASVKDADGNLIGLIQS